MTTRVKVLLAGTTSYTPPANFGTTNTIEALGAGGNGGTGIAATSSGGSGASGSYASISNTSLTAMTAVAVQIDSSGGAASTFLENNSSTVIVKAFSGGNASGATGGAAPAAGTGTTKNPGRGGGSGAATSSRGGRGGTGAPGPLGLGGTSSGAQAFSGGGGGSGANGGGAGSGGTATAGGAGGIGGNGSSVAGAGATTTTAATSGTLGAGGGGGCATLADDSGAAGSNDTTWTDSATGIVYGPGGGSGGGGSSTAAGSGGNGGYGAGAGGGANTAAAGGVGGTGGAGLLVITDTPLGPWVVQNGFNSATPSTTNQVTLTKAPLAGNLLVIFYVTFGTGMSNSHINTSKYTIQQGHSSASSDSMYILTRVCDGTETATPPNFQDGTVSCYFGAAMYEVNLNGGSVDQSNIWTSTGGTLTTVSANELCLGAGIGDGGTVGAWSSPWLSDISQPAGAAGYTISAVEQGNLSASSSVSFTPTGLPGSGASNIGGILIKNAASTETGTGVMTFGGIKINASGSPVLPSGTATLTFGGIKINASGSPVLPSGTATLTFGGIKFASSATAIVTGTGVLAFAGARLAGVGSDATGQVRLTFGGITFNAAGRPFRGATNVRGPKNYRIVRGIRDTITGAHLLGRIPGAAGAAQQIPLSEILSQVSGKAGAPGTNGTNGTNGATIPTPPQGRLTLVAATPYLTANTTGITTVYYTPAVGSYAPLWNGSAFLMTQFTELSQSLSDTTKSPAAAVASSLYDLFVWSDSGTLRCTRGPAWTNSTTRSSGLTLTQGVWVNTSGITNGPTAGYGTYVGTIATDANTQCNMNFNPAGAVGGAGNRLDVWNAYNRSRVAACNIDSTTYWQYNTETWRCKDNNVANGICFVCGLPADTVRAVNYVNGDNTNSGAGAAVGVGLDSTSTNHTDTGFEWSWNGSSKFQGGSAELEVFPGIGVHILYPLEISIAGSAQYWFGSGTASGSHIWGNSVFKVSWWC
jgi:hypothetical protein